MPKTLLTIQEAAKFLGVSAKTLRRWDSQGRLVSSSRTLGSHRRYSLQDLQALKKGSRKVKAPKFLPIDSASALLGVSTKTLRRWENQGKVEALRTPGGQRRFPLVQQNPLPAKEKEDPSAFDIKLISFVIVSIFLIVVAQGTGYFKKQAESFKLSLAELKTQIAGLPEKKPIASQEVLPAQTTAGVSLLIPSDINLLANSSFEAGVLGYQPKGWSYILTSLLSNTKVANESIRSGTLALKFEDNSASTANPLPFGISQPTTTTINGRNYIFSVNIRTLNLAGNPTLRIGFIGTASSLDPSPKANQGDRFKDFSLDGTSDWKTFSFEYSEAALGKYPFVQISNYVGGKIFLDDLALYEVIQKPILASEGPSIGGQESVINSNIIYQNITRIGDGSLTVDPKGTIYPTPGLGLGATLGTSDSRFGTIYTSQLDTSSSLTANSLTVSGLITPASYTSNPTTTGNGSIIFRSDLAKLYFYNGTSWTAVGSGSSAFSDITSGTNTTAAMIIGSGASLTYSGTGTINASSLEGKTWEAPGTIGSTTPNTGAFTSLNVSGLTASKAVFTDASKNLTSTGTLGAVQGGTGFSSYTVGDLLYADTISSLARLNDVAVGNTLISGGVGVAPSWGKIVLGTHTTGNYVSTITGTANQITANSTTGDVTLSIPSDFRAPGTVNAVTGIYTGAIAGTQRIDASGNLTSIGTTQLNGVTYTWPAASTANFILQANSTGTSSTLSWVDPSTVAASTIYWTQASGALYPKNSTVDVLIGSNATTSAKFAFMNMVGTGTPTASISAAPNSTYLTATGLLATTNMQTLTIGAPATTGNILIDSGINTVLADPTIQLSGTNPTISATATNSTLGLAANGTGALILNSGATGNIQFFSASNTLSSAGNLTVNSSVNASTGNLQAGGTLEVLRNFAVPQRIFLTSANDANVPVLYADANGQLTMNAQGAQAVRFNFDKGTGGVVIGNGAGAQAAIFTTLGQLGLRSDAPVGKLDVSGAMVGKALVIFNETGDQDILTASASGTTKMKLAKGLSAGEYDFYIDKYFRTVRNSVNAINMYQNGMQFESYQNAVFAIDNDNNDSAEYFGVVTNGGQANLLYVTQNGVANAAATPRVGIGTNAPLGVFQVDSTATGKALAIFNDTGTDQALLTASASGVTKFIIDHSGNVGIGTTAPISKLHVATNTTTLTGKSALIVDQLEAQDILTASASGVPKFVITNAGSVGIGTTSPGSRLHINVTADLDAIRINGANTTTFTFLSNIYNSGTNSYARLGCWTGSAGCNTVIDLGNVGIGTTAPEGKLAITKDATLANENTYAIKLRAADGANTTSLLIGPNSANNASVIQSFNPATDWTSKPLSLQPNGGNVGIGTTSPGTMLQVKGIGTFLSPNSGTTGGVVIQDASGNPGNPVLQFVNNANTAQYGYVQGLSAGGLALMGGNVGIGVTGPTYQLQLSTDSAAKPTSNTWTIASDVRIKNVVGDYSKGLAEILQVNPIIYTYKENNALGIVDPGEHIGIIAQDLQKVFPEAISTDKNGYLHFNSDALSWASINAIKEQQSQIASLSAQLANPPQIATPSALIQPATASAELASLATRVSNLEAELLLLKSASLTATSSGETTQSLLTNLTVLGKSLLGDTVINGKLNIGILSFDNQLGSIDAIGTLKLQPLALAGIEFLDNSIEMDKNGNFNVKKGVIEGNDKIRGSVSLAAGQTLVRVDKTWDLPPASITLTPNYNTTFWVSDKSEKGFTINVGSAPTDTQNLDWLAIW